MQYKFMSYYRDQLEKWLQTISINTEHVLDIGGASNPARRRIRHFEANTCTFFDLGVEEPVVEYFEFDINLPLTQFEGYDPYDRKEKFNYLLPTKPNLFQFDAVFCLEVFEYVWNPVQAMKNIYDLMNNDSVCYISFPAIYPVHNPVEIDYLRYTKKAIEKYLNDNGFTGIEISPRVATMGRGLLATFYSEEGMHPVRKSDLPFDIGYLVKARKIII